MNLGLAYNKFDIASPDNPLKDSKAATTWRLKSFHGKKIDQYEADRQWQRVVRLGASSRRSVRTAVLELSSPLIIGLGIEHPTEAGCLWHPALGFPYIPGSGLKGLTRAFADAHLELDSEELAWIFGADDEAPIQNSGRVIFFDALPLAGAALQVETIAPHHKDYHISAAAYPSDTESPVPTSFLSLMPGSRLGLAIGSRNNSDPGLLDEVLEWSKLAIEFEGIGSKTSRGAGRGRLE